jgi:hypothetical protein
LRKHRGYECPCEISSDWGKEREEHVVETEAIYMYSLPEHDPD